MRWLYNGSRGLKRLPFSKNANRVRCFLIFWYLKEIVDITFFMLGHQITFVLQQFELIPASGLRQAHFIMNCFWRECQVEAVHVSSKVEVQAKCGGIKV